MLMQKEGSCCSNDRSEENHQAGRRCVEGAGLFGFIWRPGGKQVCRRGGIIWIHFAAWWEGVQKFRKGDSGAKPKCPKKRTMYTE